jgi:hypothetical protein
MSTGQPQRGPQNSYQQPAFTSTSGQVILSLWSKPGKYGPIYNVKFQKMYTDNNTQELKYGDNFGASDLGDLNILIIEVSMYIASVKRQARQAQQGSHQGGYQSPPHQQVPNNGQQVPPTPGTPQVNVMPGTHPDY